MSRDEAYRIVQEAAQRAWDDGHEFRELLAEAAPGSTSTRSSTRPRSCATPRRSWHGSTASPGTRRPAGRAQAMASRCPRRWEQGGPTQSTPLRGAVGAVRPNPRCATHRKRRTRKKKPGRVAIVESPYPQRRPRAGSAGGRPEVESAAKRRRRHARSCGRKKKRPKRKVPLQPVPPAPTPPAPEIHRRSSASRARSRSISGAFGAAQAERLLWRAGFGPRPGQAEALAASALARRRAVADPARGRGRRSTAPEPTDEDGNPLAPATCGATTTCWWLDRMVRSDQPLVERMTLVWHDWFATSNDGVGDQQLMLDQNELFRAHALGSFARPAQAVTQDPAMLVFLNGDRQPQRAPERELRARADGAVHARRRPRRLHRDRRARAGARADRLARRLDRRRRAARTSASTRSGTTRHARRSSARPAT